MGTAALILCLLYASRFSYATGLKGTGTENSEGAVDDRINLNFHRGHAESHDAGGGSVSDAISKGVEVGIRRPGMADQTLYQKSDSYGTSSAYGQRPPATWAGAQNQVGNGGSRGGATAGFSGGNGVAQTQSFNQHIEIPLDEFGTVLFSNLKEKTPSHGKDATKTSPTPEVKKPNPPPTHHKSPSKSSDFNLRPELPH